jgi:drug/metabolite transporter, DME family
MSLDRLLLFAAALLFSTGGAAIKACSLTSWQIASFRSGIAALTLFLFFPRTRHEWSRPVGLTGVAYGATLISFVVANKLTTSANAIFLQSTAPLYLLLLGPLVLREPIRRFHILAISAVGCGALLLLFGSEQVVTTAPDPARGNLVAACSGVAWALTMTGFRWLGRRARSSESTLAAVIFGNLFAFVVCLPLALPAHRMAFADIAVLSYLGVFQVALAYVALAYSIRRVPALEAAVLLLIEPVFNPIWSWLVHGERPSELALVGGALIVCTALLASWWQTRTDSASG